MKKRDAWRFPLQTPKYNCQIVLVIVVITFSEVENLFLFSLFPTVFASFLIRLNRFVFQFHKKFLIMGKTHRNKNKDKDPYIGPAKSGRRDSDSDDSQTSAYTLDDDMQSIMGGVEDMNDVYDQLVDNLDKAQEKK